MRIKNWAKFQHFKDRRPPWVKLYRELLDDMEWHELDPEAAKALVMLWLIASEHDGELPDVKKLSFRLRLSEKDTNRVISKLSHWLEEADISVISSCRQDDIAPIPLTRSRETEAEKRREETESARESDFDRFWATYPKRKSRGQAEKAWAKIRPDSAAVEAIIAAVEAGKRSSSWQQEGGRYIPFPATWLNAKGWLDDVQVVTDDGWWLRSGFGSKEAAERAGVTQ